MPKINQKEYDILKGLDDKWKWITRDKDGVLGVYDEKVVKTKFHNFWIMAIKKKIDSTLFSFIQWEDEEPYSIQELIDEYLDDEYGYFNMKLSREFEEFIKKESEETEVKKDKEAYDNLYVFEDTIFNSQQIDRMGLDVEWSYVYVEPEVYPLGRNRQLIVNQEENQAEIAENTNGLLVSVGVSVEESMIKALIDIALQLERYTDEN